MPEQRLKERTGDIRILVMGGSQGARILNQTLPKVANELGAGFTIRHQVGKDNTNSVRESYEKLGIKNIEVMDFIDDVSQSYAWADLIVCRSGALTVSEVSAAGLAAIFIPYAHKDRQQALNAEHLVNCGGAKMIEQHQLSVDSLTKAIKHLDRTQLLTMANQAKSAAKLDADITVANAIKALSRVEQTENEK
jgi:UDP-N-acetylglucosamine--N-acetylmuramyl-(pentapeptide) pyrophosphoryl-undecaprenol N-acetylglucosamine transferase